MNNPKCNDYIDVIYLKELEIKDTTDAPKWANYLDHLEFDEDGKLFKRLYDKHDDFDFHIVNFPYLSSNIPESPAYGVFVSQLIRYRFIQNMKIYSGFKVIETGIFYGRHTDLVHIFYTSVSHMLNDLCTDCAHSFRNTPFGEFMILLIRYTYTLCITEFVSLRTMFTD